MNKQNQGQTIYSDPKAPHQELTPGQQKILDALQSMPRYVGPWGVVRQPGGGYIADRTNTTKPENTERLPIAGQFRSMQEALAAIKKATGE